MYIPMHNEVPNYLVLGQQKETIYIRESYKTSARNVGASGNKKEA
jgi:hypothetical protein